MLVNKNHCLFTVHQLMLTNNNALVNILNHRSV